MLYLFPSPLLHKSHNATCHTYVKLVTNDNSMIIAVGNIKNFAAQFICMKNLYSVFILIIFSSKILAQKDSSLAKNLEEVIITGQYKPQSIKNSVYQVKVINNENIRLRGANNIQQVLSNEVGFRFSNDNILGTADVQLMGMSGRNVKILLDGVPMLDRGDIRESLNQIDINSIDRIEIVNGPMSVSYGSDALACVINIITKKAGKENWSVNAKIQEETAGAEYYPFHYKGLHQQSVNIGWQRNRWNIQTGISHIDFDGFGGDPYGRAKNWRPKEQWLGNINLGYKTDHFKIYYRLDGLDENITNKGAINLNTLKTRDQKYITNRYMHQLQSEWQVNNKLQLNSLLSYTNYRRYTKTTEHNFENGQNTLTTGPGEQDTAAFKAATFRTTLQYKMSNNVSLQPGIDINYETASGQRIIGKPAITDYAFFISSEIKPNEKINIRPGLRFIKNSIYEAPPVIPAINTKFMLHKNIDLRLAYAYGFRAPALRELYFYFVDANHNIIGNPTLKAECSNSFTGSVHYTNTFNKITFTSTLGSFYNEFNNLINYASNLNNPSQFTLVNIDKFKTTGITLENTIQWKNLQASIGIAHIGRYNSFANDKQYEKDNLPDFVWSPEISSGISYRCNKIGTSFNLFYKYTGKTPGYQLNNINNEQVLQLTKVADYHWADFTINKSIFKYCTITGGVKNIFDVKNINNSASNSTGIHSQSGNIPVSYGRSFFMGIAFQWSKK